MLKTIFNYIVLGALTVFTITSCSRKKDKFLNRTWHSVNTKYNVLYNGTVALEAGKIAVNMDGAKVSAGIGKVVDGSSRNNFSMG